jgi:glycosyltransferase involved in cell wall biosynthesis
MKILYISNSRLPTEKAYGIQTVKMCESFAASGSEVLLLYPFRRSPHINEEFFKFFSIKENFELKQLPAPDFYFPGDMDRIAFYIKSFISAIFLAVYAMFTKFDIIYSRDELPLYLLSFFTKKMCFEAHKFSKAKSFYYKRFRSARLRIVTITAGLKEEFINAGFDGDKILVASDGVDIEDFNIDISREDARKRAGLPIDKNIVLYSGHLFDWKGAHIVAEAANNLPEILFVFVGGTEADIKEFKNRYGLVPNILILGRRAHADIPFYLKAGDILVLPNSGKDVLSQKFTSPLKLFEYMASKRPIVASDLPALKEVLNDQNAVFFEPDNSESLAKAIRSTLGNYKLMIELSEHAFVDVQDYNWNKRSAKILNFLT